MSQEPEVTLPMAYHAPLEVDGAWMCSAHGMASRPVPLARKRRSWVLPIALMVVLPLLVSLVVWLVGICLKH